MDKIYKTEEEWKKILTKEQFEAMRKKSTEPPFTCEFKEPKIKQGVFVCSACGLPLFKTAEKFESGTGWPSFYQPYSEENLLFRPDSNFFMQRTEVLCARCDSHLGHVFPDGPPPTGKRFCINGIALKLKEKK